MRDHFLFTSESVSEGHADKVADQISDAVVDLFLAKDPFARVACETMVTTNRVMLAGEIRGAGIYDAASGWAPGIPEEIEAAVRGVLGAVLGLPPERVARFTADTPLFGTLPELDSMAVAGVLTELEDRLGITIEDDEVDGEMLATFGALTTFLMTKAMV